LGTKVDTEQLALCDVGIDLRLSSRLIDIRFSDCIPRLSPEVGQSERNLAVIVGNRGLDKGRRAEALDVGGSLPRGSFELEIAFADLRDDGITSARALGDGVANDSGLELPLCMDICGSLHSILTRSNGNSQNLRGKQGKGNEGRGKLHDDDSKRKARVKIVIVCMTSPVGSYQRILRLAWVKEKDGERPSLL